jgi:hypothetical protein
MTGKIMNLSISQLADGKLLKLLNVILILDDQPEHTSQHMANS